ncbi:hypothetical protein AG1IA_08545 [Rhizoctonia solani AG-1 IA]|uniref:Uncharacterized protein n=1 Tax=Thanatephorus cucumeris (strain AG1-IA) TaxID=983506 RepID=L8WHK3_THACA|nr:hypothetical protein AG1IA_08545 [Rhizoctonia solani AG-1 IA]
MDAMLPPEPSAAMLNLSALAYLLGTTIITWCMARVSEKYHLWTKKAWKTMTWARICFLLVLLDSWLYLITCTRISIIGRHNAELMCSWRTIIWGSSPTWPQEMLGWHSPLPLALQLQQRSVSFGTPRVQGVMIPRAVHYVHNGYCVLGINRISHPAKHMYLCSASVMALITTSTNIAVSYVLDGKEAIWVCLGVINAIILYWAIQGPDESSESRDKSIYTSPIGDITFRWGVADGHDQLRSPGSSLRDNVSEATVAVPTMSLPPLEKPGPLIRPERSRASL